MFKFKNVSHRLEQVNELIRAELTKLMLTEIECPPGFLITVIEVETSKDLRYAKVWISILPDGQTKKILDILTRNIGHLQFLLNKRLSMRPLPRIHFAVDKTESKAAKIDELINNLDKEKE